jgi:hypothetical protein
MWDIKEAGIEGHSDRNFREANPFLILIKKRLGVTSSGIGNFNVLSAITRRG